MFSLESPHPSDSSEYNRHTIINIKKTIIKLIPNTIVSTAMGLFLLGTQGQVQNSRSKQAISI